MQNEELKIEDGKLKMGKKETRQNDIRPEVGSSAIRIPQSAIQTRSSALSPQSLIPHRPPFLFVDEVVEVDEKRIVATKYVDPAAEFFRGHYPGNPVMPGVLLCECCFQTGAILIAHLMKQNTVLKGTPVITRIKEAKFKHMVKPGDTLRIEVTLDETVNDVYFMTGRLQVGDRLALRVEFAAALVASPAL